jgi:hypothetical protein
VDGTENKQGTIQYYTDLDLQVNGKTNMEQFIITGLGNQKIILGLPWLWEHNPEINWKEGTLQWRTTTMEEVLDKEEHLNWPINASDKVLLEYLGMENKLWINSKGNLATKLASEANQKKPDLTPEQLVPQEYHHYLDIFDEDKANWFPDTRPWDHKIEMKSGFEPKSFKTYNLTPEEQVELDKFLKENLDKGYIKLSQSPMASPFFFVKKKDGKLRPCQDDWYLNNWTVKNAYPLPLISEIMDKIKGAKFFTKFDVVTIHPRIHRGVSRTHFFSLNSFIYTIPSPCFTICFILRRPCCHFTSYLRRFLKPVLPIAVSSIFILGPLLFKP